MAIAGVAQVIQSALWPQGDIRDPLGVWGFRLGVSGDVSGGAIKIQGQVPAGLSAAYLYTCYSLLGAQLTGIQTSAGLKARLLTNWPNVDTIAGVQGYSTAIHTTATGTGNYTAPITAPQNLEVVQPNWRYILLFDPRPSGGTLDIVELEYDPNTDGATYSFEGYGYFWDRSVLNAPGGPRHPGSS